jgi:hypothetical protein
LLKGVTGLPAKRCESGSATVLGLMVAMFLLILAAFMAVVVNNDQTFGTENRDVLEAQYAAEAGAKRAMAYFLQTSGNWDWSWAHGAQQTFTGNENYQVTVTINGTNTPIANNAAPLSNTAYRIVSVGRVGSATRTVTLIATTGGSGNYPVMYAGNNIVNSSNITTNGADVVYGGTINGSPHVGGGYKLVHKTLSLPTFKASDYSGSPSLPTSGNNVNLSSSKYYINGDWTISGNLNLNGNATIFVNGNLSNSNSVNINGTVLLIVNGNIANSSNFSMTKGVVIATGNLSNSSTFNINGGGALLVGGNINNSSDMNLNYDSAVLSSLNLGGGKTTFGSWNNQ